MNFVTICPLEIYQKHISKSLERKVQKIYDKPFYEKMKEVFGDGIPTGRSQCITVSPTMSKSWLHEMEWLYYIPPVSEEFLTSMKKRAFKVTYKGQLLTLATRIFL